MLNLLREFNVDDSSLTLWAFRKRIVNTKPQYTGRWVSISDELKAEIKEFIKSERNRYSELKGYDLLTDNNPVSLLHIKTAETEALKIISSAAEETEGLKVTDEKHLNNIDFYSVKLVNADTVLHCIKKTDSSWKTKKKSGLRSIVFQNHTLDIDNTPKFDIAKSFDMYVFVENIFIKEKLIFESLLSYKKAHLNNFSELTEEPLFRNVFDNLEPLEKYVGNNAMQLRRASAIKKKGYYTNPDFMVSLRQNVQKFRLNIQFDGQGKIIVTDDNCADIFQALLDHRLQSHYSQHIYDVPNALRVE